MSLIGNCSIKLFSQFEGFVVFNMKVTNSIICLLIMLISGVYYNFSAFKAVSIGKSADYRTFCVFLYVLYMTAYDIPY